jgi:hypothetical protein
VKTLNNLGNEVNAMIEVIKDGYDGTHVLMSDLREPTPDEFLKFKSIPCDHSKCKDQLIYDIPTWLYNMRYCVICNTFLGLI